MKLHVVTCEMKSGEGRMRFEEEKCHAWNAISRGDVFAFDTTVILSLSSVGAKDTLYPDIRKCRLRGPGDYLV